MEGNQEVELSRNDSVGSNRIVPAMVFGSAAVLSAMRMPVLLLLLAMAAFNDAKSAPEMISIEKAIEPSQRTGSARLTHAYRGVMRIAAVTGGANAICIQMAFVPATYTHACFDYRPHGSDEKPVVAIAEGKPKPGASLVQAHVFYAREIPSIERLGRFKKTEQFAQLGGNLQGTATKVGFGSANWGGFTLEADGSIRVVNAVLFFDAETVTGGYFQEGIFKPER